jgi:hypothetical protein
METLKSPVIITNECLPTVYFKLFLLVVSVNDVLRNPFCIFDLDKQHPVGETTDVDLASSYVSLLPLSLNVLMVHSHVSVGIYENLLFPISRLVWSTFQRMDGWTCEWKPGINSQA